MNLESVFECAVGGVAVAISFKIVQVEEKFENARRSQTRVVTHHASGIISG